MKTREAVTALAAIAQETRLSIYHLLAEAGRSGCLSDYQCTLRRVCFRLKSKNR